ncbi:MAG: DUF3300 domain-containing protein [Betaproteobacteria bacterium]|nr:DUF3300 domain-containing protein [Betaproteobacteria bacterium]
MKTFLRNMTSRLLALLAALALACAQDGAQAQPAYSFPQQELDQMLAPIALYPDALLSQILMAATYPLELVEAARWARDRPGLSGDAAVRAAETEDWDPSVKSLVAFPQVLERMDENLQWTQALGDAFLEQQSQVMDTVQALRRKAQAAGNLRSDDRLSVVQSGPSLLVQPLDPQVVYVPYYDPLVVYGSWWWPAYPPVYLRPWPGYYARPGYVRGFYWGSPIGISVGFFFGAIDWHRRQVRVVQVNNTYYNNLPTVRRANASPQASVPRPGAWHHDRDHRRGIDYRGVDAQQRVGAASAPPDRGNQAQAAEARRPVRGMDASPTWTETRRELGQRSEHSGVGRIRPEWHANQHAARLEPATRPELPRAPQPRMEFRPAQSAARQETATMAVARHEPAARHYVPQASGPRAKIRPSQAAARQDPGAKSIARPRMGP